MHRVTRLQRFIGCTVLLWVATASQAGQYLYHFEGRINSIPQALQGGPFVVGQQMSADLIVNSDSPDIIPAPDSLYSFPFLSLAAQVGTSTFQLRSPGGALGVSTYPTAEYFFAQPKITSLPIGIYDTDVLAFGLDRGTPGSLTPNQIPVTAPSLDRFASRHWFISYRVPGSNTGWALGGELTAFTISAIPEPGTYALMALGLASIGLLRRRQQQRGA